MKLLLITLLSGFMSLPNPTQSDLMLREFVRDAIDTKLSDVQLGDKYFCTALLNPTVRHGEQTRRYLDYALSRQRDLLRAEHTGPNEFVFTPFEALRDKQVNLSSEVKNVYVIQLKGKPLVYVLLKDEKIASTLLLTKTGKNSFFATLCE